MAKVRVDVSAARVLERPRQTPSNPDAPQRSRRQLVTGGLFAPNKARVTAMRRLDRPSFEGTDPLPELPPLAVVVLNRLGFGPRPGEIASFNALGGNDTARLTAWLDQQLDPASIPDTDADARIAAAGFISLNKTLEQLWDEHAINDPNWQYRTLPLVETERATLIRRVYGNRQLFEVLADFWHDHFSVYGEHYWVMPVFVHYDRDVLRANALGNFRTMLEGVAKSTAMLYYLDNFASSADGPNENYARELTELHTVGAEHYYGVIPQGDVPTDGNGVPLGFVDEDVFAITRALTGWSLSNSSWDPNVGNTGLFLYRPEWHDNGPKRVLGVDLPANQGDLEDGLDVLDILANHPGTGRFIAGKLCRRLIGEGVASSLVEQAGALFTSLAGASDQIAQVVRFIALSDEFRTTWGRKVKRPTEIVVSALRAGLGEVDLAIDSGFAGTFNWLYGQTGHQLFRWRAPNGYPDYLDDWISASPRVQTWRLTNWLTVAESDLEVPVFDPVAQTPAGVRSASQLADFWIDRLLGRPMTATTRAEVVAFMAQGRNPDFALPLDTDEDTRSRLVTMVGLIFLSPDFLWR